MNEQPQGQNPGSRVQGEGDYESARRFNEKERKFVDEHGSPRQPPLPPEVEHDIQQAEAETRERSDERKHDAVDEKIFRDSLESRKRPQ